MKLNFRFKKIFSNDKNDSETDSNTDFDEISGQYNDYIRAHIDYDENIKPKEFIVLLLKKLKNEYENLDSSWYNLGKKIGLNQGNIEIHKKRAEAFYKRLGSLYNYIIDIEKSIYEQYHSYYESINPDDKNANLKDKQKYLLKELDEKDPKSFISKANTEINKYKQKIDELEDEEWKNIKDELYLRIQQVWIDYDNYISKLSEKKQAAFFKKLEHIEEKQRNIENIIKKLFDTLNDIELKLISEKDINEIKALKMKRSILMELIDERRNQKLFLLPSLKKEAQQMDEIFNDEVKSQLKNTNERAENIKQAIESVPENPMPKSRFYLLIILIGFFFAATAEVAIMNQYTGEIFGIGSFVDQLERKSTIIDLTGQNASNVENDFSTVINTNSNKASGSGGKFLTLLFFFSFSAIPFVLSFVTKLWFDLKDDQNKSKKTFFYIAGAAGLFYISSAAYQIAYQYNKPWHFGVFLFSISLSLVLVSGWLLHYFSKSYENFKKSAKQSFFFNKSLISILKDKIKYKKSEITSKRNELEKINESIAKNKNIILDKVKKFNSLKAGVPKLEINALKESAINSLEAGYDLGVKIRGKGEINEDFIDNKPIEDLVKLDQKLKIFYKVFSETKE